MDRDENFVTRNQPFLIVQNIARSLISQLVSLQHPEERVQRYCSLLNNLSLLVKQIYQSIRKD
jgi:hypothetical protein